MSPSGDSTPVAPNRKLPCPHYSKGHCNRGDKCRYSHDTPSSTPVGTDYELQSLDSPPPSATSYENSDTRSKPKRKGAHRADQSFHPEPQSHEHPPSNSTISLASPSHKTKTRSKRGEIHADNSSQPHDSPSVSLASLPLEASDARPKPKRKVPQRQSHEDSVSVSSANFYETSETRSKPKRKEVTRVDSSQLEHEPLDSPSVPLATLSQEVSDGRSKPKRKVPQRQSHEDSVSVSSASIFHETETRSKPKRKDVHRADHSPQLEHEPLDSPSVPLATLSQEVSDGRPKPNRKVPQRQFHEDSVSVSSASIFHETSETRSKPKRKEIHRADHSSQLEDQSHYSPSVSLASLPHETSDTRSKPKRKEIRSSQPQRQSHDSPPVSLASLAHETPDARSKPKHKEIHHVDYSSQLESPSVSLASLSHEPSDTRSKSKRKEIHDADYSSELEHQSHDSPLVSSAAPSHGASDYRGKTACKFWPNCNKGSKCPYKHDGDAQKRSHKQTSSSSSVLLHTDIDPVAQPPSYAELIRERNAEVARERESAISREEASKTISELVCGCIVTYSAGLDVSNLTTGFETCTLRIRNLPFDVTEDDIHDFLGDRDGGVHRSHITVKKKSGLAEALIVTTDIATGRALSGDPDGIEFQDETIRVEMNATNSAVGTKAASGRGSEIILSVSWPAPPAVSYVAEYDNISTANAKVKKLDGCHYEGRPILVTMNSQPSNRFVPNLTLNAIKINNLPPSVTDQDIKMLTGALSVKRIGAGGPSGSTFTVEHITRLVQEDIKRVVPGGPEEFHAPRTCNKKGIYYAHAHFSSWDDAHAVYTRLSAQRYGSQSIRFYLPMHFAFDIPVDQYNAQKAQWDSLESSVKAKKTCALDINESGKVVNIRLSGPVKEMTGALKGKVKSLGRGERVEGWHRTFGISDNLIVPRVYSKTGAYLRVDSRQRSLALCGMPGNIDRARKMIKSELEKLDSLEYTITLERRSVGFFVREGIQQLQETLGEDNVRFAITKSSRQLTVSGGEEAGEALDYVKALSQKRSRNLPNAARGNQICPVCYDPVSSPHQKLGCGHTYCVACLRLFISSALGSDELPLTCLGNQPTCRAPIAIPTLERFLPLESFNQLQEAALDAYIVEHREFQRCKTPNCTQIYRAARRGAAPQTLQCPSCLSAVCNGCHEDAHLGISCVENKARVSAEQERLNEARVASQEKREKKCPRCSVRIEKPNGANYVTCRCGAYICLRCMRVFTVGTIHNHMQASHGIARDVPAPPEPAPEPASDDDDTDIPDDPEVQRELMREALEYRKAARDDNKKREEPRTQRPKGTSNPLKLNAMQQLREILSHVRAQIAG